MANSHNNTHGPLRGTSFAPVAMDAGAFDAQREVIFGARARLAALTVTKTQDELQSGYQDDLATLSDTLDMLDALSEECQAIMALADAATARLLIVGSKICEDACDSLS